MEDEGERFKDITVAEIVELVIREDGKVVWVNTEKGCILRICRIGRIMLYDRRSILQKGSSTGQ
jgi:hypothetical protein